jgi:hypothetical protein|tara:strand:+ start:23 stop:334 length:312 start_codon:yes stop_codon:yes gene_type:complete
MNENIKVEIADWNTICSIFAEMFEGLGKIDISQNIVSFQSLKPYVATGITLDSNGRVFANMPLHAIETEFQIVHFSADKHSIKLTGENSSYEYRIPPEILNLR